MTLIIETVTIIFNETQRNYPVKEIKSKQKYGYNIYMYMVINMVIIYGL